MSNQRLREALAGVPSNKEKGTPAADGILTVTPDSPEAAEWRNKSVLDCVATTSSYLQDDTDGRTPSQLFGKFTWKIENWSEISKRELRSNQFDVGEYKWYILVYPNGCDVCNHLSLFLCVADYDKLLPGWSHFAQFTIAVVNKDPKKSKYSDTLHRFCKKEHDWGWKKFMELSKVMDGFTVSDTLVIKAQVQVILDKPSRPFRCLDPQYRRELVRVYLTNVESICRRFCDEKRAKLAWLKEEQEGFRAWWRSLSKEQQREMVTDKGEVILKGLVKQFFNEKEVTSTLVMDALYSGCRQLEEAARFLAEGKPLDSEARVLVRGDRNLLYFGMDALNLAQRACSEYIPPSRHDKALPAGADGVGLRSGGDGDTDLRRDSVERDEKRLAELGRRTVEMYALAHVFTERLEAQYRHAQALKRMEALIAEEEEAGRLQDERAQARLAADKEKRAKKKERKKAKQAADKAKKDAEEAEQRAVEAARCELEALRAAELNQRRRVEEAAEQALQQAVAAEKRQRQQQQQHATQCHEAAAAAKAAVEAARVAAASALAAPAAHAVDEPASGSGRGACEAASKETSRRRGDAAAVAVNGVSCSSSSSMPIKGSSSGWLDHRGRASGASSPATGSLADSCHEPAPRSLADSSHDADTSDTCSIDSGKAVGPAASAAGPRTSYDHLNHHHHHHGAAMNGPSSRGSGAANGHLHPHQASHSVAGPSQQQQQQEQQHSIASSSSSCYIPSGYAAAVAHRPSVPQGHGHGDGGSRTREQALEEEVGALRKRVRMLENTLAERGQQLAEGAMEVSNLRATISDMQQTLDDQQQQMREDSEAQAVLQRQHTALQQQHTALQHRNQQLQQEHSQLQQRHQQLQHDHKQQQQQDGWPSEGTSGRHHAWQAGATSTGGAADARVSSSSGSSEPAGHGSDAVATTSSRPAPWATVTAGTAVSYSAAAAGKGDGAAGTRTAAAAAAGPRSSGEDTAAAAAAGPRRTGSMGGGSSSGGGTYSDTLAGTLRLPQQQLQTSTSGITTPPPAVAPPPCARSTSSSDDRGEDGAATHSAPSTPFARSAPEPASVLSAGAWSGAADTSSTGAPPADKAPGGNLAGSSTPRFGATGGSSSALEAVGSTDAAQASSKGGSSGGSGAPSSSVGGASSSSGAVAAAAPGDASVSTPAAAAAARPASDVGEASASGGIAAGPPGTSGRASLEEGMRPSSSAGSDSGSLTGGGHATPLTSYMGSMLPGQSSMSSAFGGSGLAGNLRLPNGSSSDGGGPSSSGAGGLPRLSGSLGLGSMTPKHLGEGPQGALGMAARNVGGDHGYSAFARGSSMGFAQMAAAATKGPAATAGSRNLEDANLDGFVHMNMIDDLLTE